MMVQRGKGQWKWVIVTVEVQIINSLPFNTLQFGKLLVFPDGMKENAEYTADSILCLSPIPLPSDYPNVEMMRDYVKYQTNSA